MLRNIDTIIRDDIAKTAGLEGNAQDVFNLLFEMKFNVRLSIVAAQQPSIARLPATQKARKDDALQAFVEMLVTAGVKKELALEVVTKTAQKYESTMTQQQVKPDHKEDHDDKAATPVFASQGLFAKQPGSPYRLNRPAQTQVLSLGDFLMSLQAQDKNSIQQAQTQCTNIYKR